MKIRRSVLAGTWYPDTAAGCRREIDAFLEHTAALPVPEAPVVGGIVPHAGWFYSGSLACRTIEAAARGEKPDTVVIYGMHLRPADQPRIMAEGAWETPLGPLAIDAQLAARLLDRGGFVVETTERFSRDNTIEVQLPLIRHFFGEVKILPLGVPPAPVAIALAREIAEHAAVLQRRIKAIGSTDLTHYGTNYGFAPRGSGPAALAWMRNENDRRIIDAMLQMAPAAVIDEALKRHNACCAGAAAAAIETARRLGAQRAQLLDYATSHDKSPGTSFVGYTGVVFQVGQD